MDKDNPYNKDIQVDIDEKEYVSDLKHKIYKQEYLLPENQILIYAGKQLLNDKTISYYNIF